MNLLNDFFLKQANLKIQKRLGEDRIVDSLKRFFFFSNKNILKFNNGWGKIGLWIPWNDFFFFT